MRFSSRNGTLSKWIAQQLLAVFLTLLVSAHFASPALASTLAAAATISSTVFGCTSDPCVTNFAQSSTVSAIPLSTFGDSYTLTSFIPALNGIVANTPGQMIAQSTTVTAAGTPSPTLTASMGNGGEAGTTLTYFFEVVGSGSTVNIGVNSIGSLSTQTSTGGQPMGGNALQAVDAVEELLILGVLSDTATINYTISCSPTCGQFGNMSNATGNGFVSTPGQNGAFINSASSNMFGGINESGNYTISTNTQYEVEMILNLQNIGSSGVAPTASATGSIDPIITVPNGYTLELSPGVGNSAATTPEPGTWALLTAGVAVLMAAKRRGANRGNQTAT